MLIVQNLYEAYLEKQVNLHHDKGINRLPRAGAN
jgi:hypothetical protein